MPHAASNVRPDYDSLLQQLADYALHYQVDSTEALETAHVCLLDALGCALLALRHSECARLLGPFVPGTQVPCGSRVPGTRYSLDPVKAAWDIGCLIRWLDFNDTWLAAEWGHPSDNLGAILAVADHLAQQRDAQEQPPLCMRAVLEAMVVAYEIQGVLAMENAFNRVGLDHVVLVKLASCAASARLLGATREQLLSALSHVFADGQALRVYRHAPNTGSRKSWAAGDASSRGVFLARLAMQGEMGIPGVLSALQWGFEAVSFHDAALQLSQPLDSYVMENILFKVRYPAEFHGQTACEAAIRLHPQVRDRVHEVQRIVITTQSSAIRIISKVGPLANAADRDHCLQYMVAVALLEGELKVEHYSDGFHRAHPLIDTLRERTDVVEEPNYSRDYLAPDKRAIANAVQVFFCDGSSEKVEVQYPLGHRRRRAESLPLLGEKFRDALATRFAASHCQRLLTLCADRRRLEGIPVAVFMAAFAA